MIKQEIVEKISQFFKLTLYDAEKIFDDIFSKIMLGVKEDNIVDVVNFGEFIIKYNNGKNGTPAPYKKTIEFLTSSVLEDEIGHKNFDLIRKQVTGPTPQIENIKPQEKPVINEPEVVVKKIDEPIKKPDVTEYKEPIIAKEPEKVYEISQQVKSESESSTESIEDDFKKKREALLNKITIHPLQDSERVKKPDIHEMHYNIPKEDSSIEEQRKAAEIDIQKQEQLNRQDEEKKKAAEEENRRIDEVVKRRLAEEEKKKEIEAKQKVIAPIITTPVEDDMSQKSFADYFTEVQKEDKAKVVSIPEEKETIPHVIPKKAVELHQEITNTAASISTFPNQTIQTADQFIEHRADDKSYYIWYKDSEPNVNETQTMTYEYELLYQATKEAEYKSKLRIYVSTFILFFSIVLILLLFSPFIYKIFFTPPADNQENIQNQNNEEQNPNGPTSYDQKATLNIPPIAINQNNVVADTLNNNQKSNPSNVSDNSSQTSQKQQQQTQQQPVTKESQTNKQSASQQQSTEKPQTQQKTQTSQQQTQQSTDPKLNGVLRNTMGWSDEKLKVIYVQLDNGKYTIQESAWDSDSKANKRISLVESMKIGGMKGSVLKADLGTKGVWFRARFGEFSTLEEAKQKAEELRNKEKVRFQAALLMYFLLYA